MKEAVVIFPTTIFEKNELINKSRKIFIWENKRYFTDFKFHKKKLIFHRATLRAYYDYLKNEGYNVSYINFYEEFQNKDYKLLAYRVYDQKLENELKQKIQFYDSPAFWGGKLKKSKKYFLHTFYIAQRKRLNILIQEGKPIGGKWSFDDENRKKLPPNHKVPKVKFFGNNRYVTEAQNYVQKHFLNNPGNSENFFYPVTFGEAYSWLEDFIENRFKLFGDFEDAIGQNEDFIYHSVLSPLLNVGLITPKFLIDKVLNTDVPINSKEGFIRQIIGWREFILQIYLLEGEKQRKSNYFENYKKIPENFYIGNTNIPPVDNIIKKVIKNAYNHHIERLMILSNFMLLNEFDPNEVYKWFMEMYVDSYDWVMVPNVYGMGQYADGGLMSTKPYISSSRYILKMSDFDKGEWSEKWDKLFWDFLIKHREKLEKNSRMRVLYRHVDRKNS
ncbi:MAG: cryptochrome/photolyase family protein [Candidatus Dojkabacteria bacterium]|nr:MAG: cryptochrome/photolyase family protein [Candidatus Dojkabacteria bacterium]